MLLLVKYVSACNSDKKMLFQKHSAVDVGRGRDVKQGGSPAVSSLCCAAIEFPLFGSSPYYLGLASGESSCFFRCNQSSVQHCHLHAR